MSAINITDAGPTEGTFSIDLSPGPGVYEFRGARGTGKTTCISTIDLQPTDRKKLHELAADKDLYVFGAQVDDGELRVAWLGADK